MIVASTAKLPRSRVPAPTDAPVFNWGILGTGWAAEHFALALRALTKQRIRAVGSRSAARAAAFARRFEIPDVHSSYGDMVENANVDIVYVASTHPHHLEHATAALRAGKHVLVEKPITLTAIQGRALLRAAADAGLFCAEALWTLHLPKFDVVRQVIDAGLIGTPRTFLGDLGQLFPLDHRNLRHEEAGGPVLDMGVYPIAVALAVLGVVDRVESMGTTAPTGVNGQAGILLGHAEGGLSVLHTTVMSVTSWSATIAGSEGTLSMPSMFFGPGAFEVSFADGRQPLRYDEDRIDHLGMAYEAADAARCIGEGGTRPTVRTHEDTIATLEVMDTVRRQVGNRTDADDW